MQMHSYALSAQERGIQVIIAGAGGAAHSPGMVATSTFPFLLLVSLCVLLHWMELIRFYLYCRCREGSPVATVAINNATNAGLLEVQMLAVYDADLFARISQYQEDTKSEILAEDEKLQKVG